MLGRENKDSLPASFLDVSLLLLKTEEEDLNGLSAEIFVDGRGAHRLYQYGMGLPFGSKGLDTLMSIIGW